MDLRRFPTLPAIGAVGILYFLAGKLCLHLAFVHASASPAWPPTGIAIVALLLLGYRVWPGIFIGAFLVNVSTAGNYLTSLGIATGNTLEGVCAAFLINHFAGGNAVFNRYQTVFKFALAILVSTLVAPTIGVTSLTLGRFANWANFAPI
ncbi:MAG TPA: MASE1 domain-containing protein, partial [Chthoniobacterales bacterium]